MDRPTKKIKKESLKVINPKYFWQKKKVKKKSHKKKGQEQRTAVISRKQLTS